VKAKKHRLTTRKLTGAELTKVLKVYKKRIGPISDMKHDYTIPAVEGWAEKFHCLNLGSLIYYIGRRGQYSELQL
jgi:hypothetical protein